MKRIAIYAAFLLAIVAAGCSGTSDEPQQPAPKEQKPIPSEVEGPPESGTKQRR